MPDDSDVSVRFGADTAGVESGAAAAGEAVSDFGAQVSEIAELIRAQTEAITEGFAEMAAASRASMQELAEGEERAEAGMLGLLASVREGAEGITEMREAIMGFGEAMLAVFAFEELKEFVEGLGEAGERIQHTAQAFGMTTAEVQRLQTVFTAAGAGPEVLQSSMMRLDRAASQAVSGQKRAADAFKELGVNLAEPMSSAQRLEATLQGFASIQGPDKIAVAMAVFGRNIQTIAPLLGMTKDQLEEYNAQADKFGTVNEEAVGRMAALGATLNENKNAFAGLQNVLGDALSPAFVTIVEDIDDMIASFSQSYASMGLARQVMDLLAATIESLGVIIKQIGAAFASVWDAITGQSKVAGQALEIVRELVVAFGVGVTAVALVVEVAFDAIGGAINVLEDDFRTLGDVTRDALTLNWGKIAGDYQAGLDRVHGIVQAAIARTKADVAGAAKDIDGLVNPEAKSEASPKSTIDTVHSLGGEKKPKKPKDDLVSQWNEQLKQIDDLQQNWYADQNALAAKFWAGIVASGAGSAKDQQQAQDSLAEALKALDNEQVTSAVETAKKKADAAKGDVAQVEAIYSALEATLTARHAQGGAEWAKVEEAKVEAVRKAVAEMRAEQTKIIQDQAKAAQSGIQAQGQVGGLKLQGQESATKSQSSMGAINPQQELARLAVLHQQEYELSVQTDQRILASKIASLQQIAAEEGRSPAEVAEINAQIAALTAENDNKLLVMAQQNTNRIAQDAQAKAQQAQQHWQSIFSPIASGFASTTNGMLMHTESFGQGMMKMLDSLLERFIEWEFEQVARHAAAEVAKTGATAAGVTSRTTVEQAGHAQSLMMSLEATLKQVTNAAVAAAAQAYQALAGIPIVGPALGAAAAAVTFTAVEAYGAMASASGGYDIGNENPLTQLHAQEMVLPASIANPLRGMIAANSNGPGGGSGGTGGVSPAAFDKLHAGISANTASNQRLNRTAGRAMRAMA